jgi:FixJ family two-component response regulator
MAAKIVISIVDDDDSVREATMSLMKALGFDSEAFSSAEDFLLSERRHRTDCVIADVQMPGMTGLELYRRLSASDTPIPTVLITAHADDNMRANALKAGVIGYLTKPFKEKDLMGCINSALDGKGLKDDSR